MKLGKGRKIPTNMSIYTPQEKCTHLDKYYENVTSVKLCIETYQVLNRVRQPLVPTLLPTMYHPCQKALPFKMVKNRIYYMLIFISAYLNFNRFKHNNFNRNHFLALWDEC